MSTLIEMMTELRDAGVAFDEDDEMPPGFWLNMNDTFAYACADAELVEESSIHAVYDLWKRFGWEGAAWWVWQKRQEDPIDEIKKAVLKKIVD